MAGETTLAVWMAVLAAIVIVMVAVCVAAAAARVLAAAIGLAQRSMPHIQPLATLALTPNQVLIMATLQTGSLATVTELMQQVNLLMITATL
ncbi:hypothetical protein [Pseudomonas izuensis]|uniref:hypothetical protein n=1 Tax=Pseudomonas izuensis TaxID=2684212 RepID=UPI0013595382|nr:hypothetical protein [Pseudomonas izuensis]